MQIPKNHLGVAAKKIGGNRMTGDGTERTLEHTEQDGDIRYGARDGSSSILAVSDGDNAVFRYEPDGRL